MLKHSAILYIFRNKLQLILHQKGQQTILDFALDYTKWTIALKQLAKKYNLGSLHLLFSDELCYLTTLILKKAELDRPIILNKLKTIIPEEITQDNFDWCLASQSLAQPQDQAQIQCWVIPQTILNNLSQAIKNSNLKAQSITSLTLELAELTANIQEPQLILWQYQEALGVVAHKGLVYYSKKLETTIDQEASKIIEYAKNNYNLIINKIILDGVNPEMIQLQNPNLKTVALTLNPLISLWHKKMSKGNDEEILELHLPDTVPIPNNHEGAKPLKVEPFTQKLKLAKWLNKKIVISLILILLFISIIGGIYYYQNYFKHNFLTKEITIKPNEASPIPTKVELETENPATAEPTPENTPAETQPPEINLDLSKLLLRVENGTGEAGAAAYVAEILKAEGFTNFSLGNAETYDSEQLTIQKKVDVPQDVIDILERALNSDYEIEVQEEVLTPDNQYDLLIITGKK